MLKPKCDIDVISVNTGGEGGRVLYVVITMNGTKILLVNIYAPNEDNPEFFKQIFNDISQVEVGQLLIGGDYNLVLDVNVDKEGGRAKTNEKAQKYLLEGIENLDLVDIWRIKNPATKEYTWRRKKPNLIQCRLDFFLISAGLANMVRHISINSGYLSDHSVVNLILKTEETEKGPGYWKLNCSLLKDTEYVKIVKETINNCDNQYSESGIDELLLWETMKMEIRGATIRYSAQKRKKEKKLIREYGVKIHELEQKGVLCEEERAELEKCKTELDEIFNKKLQAKL